MKAFEGFLIDANLPQKFSFWNTPDCIHVAEINRHWSDNEIWDYARENNLVIVTKDADFSNRILYTKPPPKVIHFLTGNLKLNELYETTGQKLNRQQTVINLSGYMPIKPCKSSTENLFSHKLITCSPNG